VGEGSWGSTPPSRITSNRTVWPPSRLNESVNDAVYHLGEPMTVRVALMGCLLGGLAMAAHACVTADSGRPVTAPVATPVPPDGNGVVVPSDRPPSTAPKSDPKAPQIEASEAPRSNLPNTRAAAPETPKAPAPKIPRAPTPETPKAATPETPKAAPGADHPTAPLDLTSLERRLRDTKAIGVFTKLSLKNQVDDLLQQVKLFHRGQGRLTLAELKERFNLLLLKVLSLLQAGDPPLARDVAASRDALWGVLEDPVKFAAVTQGDSQ
jgi:hypothetical protein